MKIAVLGAGPLGLVAAHAAELYGHEVLLYGVDRLSLIRGAIYIHDYIVDAVPVEPQAEVTFKKIGTKAGYARKVYGDADHECSWDRYDGTVPAWDATEMNETLRARFANQIRDMGIRAPQVQQLVNDNDLVFSTINPQGYCMDPDTHEFTYVEVHIESAADETVPESTIVYNGRKADEWYRSSNLFGAESTEYPHRVTRNTIMVAKPQSTTCDCFLDESSMHRVGRYGAFERDLLITDGWQSVVEVLDEM